MIYSDIRKCSGDYASIYWKRIYTALKIRESKLENIYLALSDNLKQKINLNKIVMSINDILFTTVRNNVHGNRAPAQCTLANGSFSYYFRVI